MALSTTTYALSKKYTDKSIEGLGAIKGAPCTIKSTTETSEGTEVVFEWTGTDGSTETKTITIKNGVSITDIEISGNNHLICTMSDGSTIDAGEVPNVKGDTGFSPTIEENPNNTDEIYKLDITNESGTFTTPNLKGTGGGLDPDRYYDKTQVDALIEPLDEAKHTHENKENVLDKLTTNATGDTLLFNGQEIKGSVEIDDTTTTAEDKAWSAKKINDTIDEVKQSVTEVDNKFSNYDTSTEVDNKITNALADYSTTTEIDTKLTDYAKTADVDTKLADYYKKTETYSNTEIDDKFTDFETNFTDDIKAWVNSEESLAIKTALYNNNTLTFYKKPNATVDDIADFSINLPEEQFLDQTKTTFINNFVWSEELYPNSTNPNLDNQPVLVLGVKGDTDVVYSFVSMNELVKIYKASTTVSTVTLTIDDATNTISAEVNISADEGNLLEIGTDGGLYAKATVDNALSDTSENPVQNKVINAALNSKANTSDLSEHTDNAEIHVTAEEKASWNNKAELTDIPSSLPADGGNADTIDGKHASDLAYLTDIIGGLRRGWASTDIGTIMTYNDREVVKTTNDLSYIGWTVNSGGWFVPIVVSQYSSGTNYTMFGNNYGYGISQDSECASFAYKGRTYYACWSNGGAYQNPTVVGGFHLTLANNDYISACKTLIDACEAIDAETVDGLHASDFALKTDIPTSLPADGGNADTLDGKHASDFVQNLTPYVSSGNIKDYMLSATSGFTFVGPDVTGMPNDNTWWFLRIEKPEGTHIVAYATSMFYKTEYRIIYNYNDGWMTSWVNTADGGDADTLDGLHANEIASNPNLIDNPDFKVNQRGSTIGTNTTGVPEYCVDRWKYCGSFEVADDGIIFSADGSNYDYGVFSQITNISTASVNEITLSAWVDGVKRSASGLSSEAFKVEFECGYARVIADDKGSGMMLAEFIVYSGKSMKVNKIKVEAGNTATLFSPPNPADELMKCQRYYQIRSTGDIPAVDLRPTMRDTPTITQLSDGNYAYSAEL